MVDKMKYFDKKAQGFSLVEVMIAVLVLAVGILAVSKLQTSLLRSGADSHNRVEASALAEKKMDDLRRFAAITDPVPGSWDAALTSPTSVYFDQIITDEGGLIGPGAFPDTEFSLSWTVNDYYYPDKLTTPVIASSGEKPDFKKVTVTVSWTNVSNEVQNVGLESVIFSYPPLLTSLSDDVSAGPRPGPKGLYTPLLAPDVVPIKITGDGVLKETSKPRPEVTKQDYATVVDFETVTYKAYDVDPNYYIALRRENFSTVACSCSENRGVTPDVTHIYGYTTWDTTDEQYIDYVTTVTNSNNDTEDFAGSADIVECALCCKDGQYTEDQLTLTGTDITLVQPFGTNGDESTNGTVDKVCRIKTIDGVPRVVAPWKLIGFNVIPASYFDDSFTSSTNATNNISSYSNYVTSLVRSTLGTVTSDYSLSVVNVSSSFKTYAGSGININLFADNDYTHTTISTASSNRTIQARAIYMDYPPGGIYNNPTTSTDYTAANVPLDRIPFYEINVTGLVGWAPDEDGVAFTATPYTDLHDDALQGANVKDPCQVSTNCVSNQKLTNKTFGDYERGEFYPNGPSEVVTTQSKVFHSSDGIVDADVNSNADVDSSVKITVTSP